MITRQDYFDTLKIYTKSHRLKNEDGSVVRWIDENQNPQNGDWIPRTRLKARKNGTWDAGKGGIERGKGYNHSAYCDLIITGLIGLRPRADDLVEVIPHFDQLHNLAAEPAHEEARRKLAAKLKAYLQATRDSRETTKDSPWKTWTSFVGKRWEIRPDPESPTPENYAIERLSIRAFLCLEFSIFVFDRWHLDR